MVNLHLFSILLLSLSTNLDNFGVGFAYGIRRICIPLRTNILIAFVNAAGTLMSMAIGERLYSFMQPEIATYVGSALFLIAGCWLTIIDILKRFKKKALTMEFPVDESEVVDKTSLAKKIVTIKKPAIIGLYCEGQVTPKEGILLAVALTFSNLVTGVGAALIGLNIVITTLLVFLFGIFAILIGMRIGGYTGRRWLAGLADPIAGLLLIVIGIYEMVF
jgi:putative sporulation protein YtaF